MQQVIDRTVSEIGRVLLGKDLQIRQALCCLIAGGHLLLEDLPGMGKTTLSHALARALGLDYGRVQFTSDLLPSDILGLSIFDRDAGGFAFQPGPIFSQVLLADEINRATPRTQSALLEAMAEGQVSIDGETRVLPDPFFVIATQNPAHQSGTYALPESQLDRFLMRLTLGYPDPRSERQLLLRGKAPDVSTIEPVLQSQQLQAVREQVIEVKVSDSLVGYLQRLVAYSRNAAEFSVGLSPRGALALITAARTWAVIEGRDFVIPEDVQAVLSAVVAHRVIPSADFAGDGNALVALLRDRVDVIPD
ncbi:ATPase, AAA family [Luminiphilus syltensis NOR5-1B]|uniref:ATPase, AAA family n=1 Tax=Luminiphilus syltensis NOR5-1B TaxID=565045 RepID=B8KYE4_9GAMM|nr:AAA family ATPase [Luminiphilus syltensis]EED34480.1 ATPase, AAA family [Luminiphilus syltensis NOR5-1B]